MRVVGNGDGLAGHGIDNNGVWRRIDGLGIKGRAPRVNILNERNGLTDMGNECLLSVTYSIDATLFGTLARIALGESIIRRVQLDVGSEAILEAVVVSCVVARGLLLRVMRMKRMVPIAVKE